MPDAPHAALTDDERVALHEDMAAWAKVMPYNHLGLEYGLSDGIWTRLDHAVERILAGRVAAPDPRIDKIRALLPDQCYVTRSPLSCTALVGGTFPAGGAFTGDMCCLPCQLRAVLDDTTQEQP